MVYAMVMSGNQEQVTDVLEKHLLTGGKYKQAIVLSALRNIGTPRAVGLIQKYAEAGRKAISRKMQSPTKTIPSSLKCTTAGT